MERSGRDHEGFMITKIFLLSCALTLGQAPEQRADWQLTPQLSSGLELVYRGEYTHDKLIPNVQHQHIYRLDANILLLETGPKDWQVALLTALSLQDSGSSKKVGPTSMRVELARLDHLGRVRGLDQKILELPVQGPPTLEFGFVAAVPLAKVGKNHAWDITSEGKPIMRWQVTGTESTGGLTCIKLVGVQQTDDWERPRADTTAWRRRDTIWLHPQLNVAQKVERIIERKAPARDTATEKHTVRYELESHLKYPNVLFQDRKQEIMQAAKYFSDTKTVVQQPALHRAQIDLLYQRVTYQLERQPNSPYRKAFEHLKGLLANARKGETPVPHGIEEPRSLPIKTVSIGQRSPDFVVSSMTQEATVSLKHFAGKPVLIFFYNPATGLGKEVITHAKNLYDKHSNDIGLMALAVTDDVSLVRKQHVDLKLAFPILDGNGMRLTFGATQTPRFIILDSQGLVRFAQTGWGVHTSTEIEEILERALKK
jgi:peroxiredoxin